MREIKRFELFQREELVVVVDFASALRRERIGIVRVFGHFFDEIIEETAPFWRRAELGDEECVLLAAFVGGEKHAAVLAPGDGVEVNGWLDGGPGGAVAGVPDFDDAFVGGEDMRVGGLATGLGGGGEVDEVLDWVAVTLVFFKERFRGAEVVEVD